MIKGPENKGVDVLPLLLQTHGLLDFNTYDPYGTN